MRSHQLEVSQGRLGLAGSVMPLVAALALFFISCDSRNLGTGRPPPECWDLWDCNPGQLCGEMTSCVDFLCQTEAPPVIVDCPGDDCLRDSDCVVAEPMSCCSGCPRVARRADLGSDPALQCFFEQGTVAPVPPPECLGSCAACPLCFPQPLGARCELGLCVPSARGCPSGLSEPPTSFTVAQLVASPAIYEGQLVRVVGTLLPSQTMCTDVCPAPRCCESAMTLDGAIGLVGNPCDLQLGLFSDDYCADVYTSEGPMPGAPYEAWGTAWLTSLPGIPLLLELDTLRLPQDVPLGVAGAYDVTVTQIISDAYDPICVPPTLAEGAFGRLYLAEAGGLARAVAPMFDCYPELRGSAPGGGRFETRPMAQCLTCDIRLQGEVAGSRVYGVYVFFDGTCRHEYYFEGVRDLLKHPYPW